MFALDRSILLLAWCVIDADRFRSDHANASDSSRQPTTGRIDGRGRLTGAILVTDHWCVGVAGARNNAFDQSLRNLTSSPARLQPADAVVRRLATPSGAFGEGNRIHRPLHQPDSG